MVTNMQEIQDKILEVAIYLDEFCKEHEITYYLMGGSALGAIRHQGFIPWDDDFDVFMTYDNYKKFIVACENYLNKEHYYFQKENTEEWPLFFSKIRMNNTTYIEEDTQGRNMHKGIFIDIMCLNNASKNVIYRCLQYVAARLIIARTLAIRGYTTNSRLKKTTMLITKYVINKTVLKWLLKMVRGLNNKETGLVGHFFGRAGFKNTSFRKEFLGIPRYVEFSQEKLPVPEMVEEYLKVRYGNEFMRMPDQKTRDCYPSHAVFVDTEKDYKYYDRSYKNKLKL
ncbi:LicD family protein [Sutcliffiella halmapala]|uniref:LicD family protein n=1 Tax=Sutcliffiella halmapala TaxID=79882 RepID=UPI00099514B7|nr:LicD family protein [Sutcliffiella halmapala]